MDDKLILNFIKNDIKNIDPLLEYITTETESTGVKISANDGRVFSCGRVSCLKFRDEDLKSTRCGGFMRNFPKGDGKR